MFWKRVASDFFKSQWDAEYAPVSLLRTCVILGPHKLVTYLDCVLGVENKWKLFPFLNCYTWCSACSHGYFQLWKAIWNQRRERELTIIASLLRSRQFRTFSTTSEWGILILRRWENWNPEKSSGLSIREMAEACQLQRAC